MSFRLVEVVLPAGQDVDTEELFGERGFLGSWRTDGDDGRTVFHLLLPVEETEAVMDKLEQRFSGLTGFHVVLLPTEAVLPRPEPEKEPPAPAEEEPGEKTDRVSREELYANVSEGMEMTRTYLVLIVLSSLVIVIIMRKFEHELKVLQGLTSTVHAADVSRFSRSCTTAGKDSS